MPQQKRKTPAQERADEAIEQITRSSSQPTKKVLDFLLAGSHDEPKTASKLELSDAGLPESSSLNISSPNSRLLENSSMDCQNSSLPESSSPPLKAAEKQLDTMASLPHVEGYTKFWHQMTDHLYRQLDPAEQVVHLQLFRLSWGYNKPSCLIGLPQLALRSNISRATAQKAIQKLIKRGLIRKLQTIQGSNKEQGNEYQVVPPPIMTGSLNSGSLDSSSLNSRHIKEKALKENLKRKSAAPDTKNCPDCQGSGFWYPEGIEKGVARCKHERLTQAR